MTDPRAIQGRTGGPFTARRAAARAGAAACGVAALAVMVACGGCVKQSPTVAPPPQVPSGAWPLGVDPGVRVQELSKRSAEFAAISHQLPGANPEQDRQLMRQVFTSLPQVLPLVQGPTRSGVFDHQLSAVTLTRAQLASRSPDLSIDPIVDNGLRAARNALDDAAHTNYAQDAKVGEALDKLAAKLQELDTVHGSTHSLVVAQAVDLTSQVIASMASSLNARLAEAGGAGGAATGPSTTPAAEPSMPGPAATPVVPGAAPPETKPAEPTTAPAPPPPPAP